MLKANDLIPFFSNTYHFSPVTEKRQFFVLLVAEDLNLSPLRMDAALTGEPLIYLSIYLSDAIYLSIPFDGCRIFPHIQLDIEDVYGVLLQLTSC